MEDTKKADGGHFHSRFAAHVLQERQADEQGMIWTVCAFAALAECVNTVVTPDITVRGAALTGTFCNLFGALLCGIASALGTLGPNSSSLADAFKGGFVAAFTSFCHMVENTVALECAGSPRSQLFFASAVVGGPLAFSGGRFMAGAVLGGLGIRPSTGETQRSLTVIPRARLAAVLGVLGFVVFHSTKNGPAAGIELAIGVGLTAAACIAGDYVGLAVSMLMPPSSVNWGTIAANTLALMFVVVCQSTGGLYTATVAWVPHPTAKWLALVFAEKFRGSFCGALSGYGGFSEDSVGSWKEPDVAAANLGMNTFISVICITVLHHMTCGLPLFEVIGEL